MEKLLEVALVDNKFDGAGKWAITVRQVDGDSDKVPACQSGGEGWGGVRGRLNKGPVASANTCVWKKANHHGAF